MERSKIALKDTWDLTRLYKDDKTYDDVINNFNNQNTEKSGFEHFATNIMAAFSDDAKLEMISNQDKIDNLQKIIDIYNYTDKDKAIEKIKDSNSTPQEFVLEDEKRHLINDAMERLSPREQEIIKYRYNSEDGVLHSFAEVAEKLGISRQRVQKIEQKAIKEMKEYIKNCEK